MASHLSSTFALCLLFSLLAITPGCQAESTLTDPLPVAISGRTFQLELAMTPDARRQGLSGRKEMADDHGMLFAFPDAGVQRFWMKDCYFAIDLIYLDAGGRIVEMHHMPPPPPEDRNNEEKLPTYPSKWPAQFAIELKGGTLEILKLERGQKIDLPLEDLKAKAR